MFRFFQPEKTNDAHYTVLMNDLHQTAQDLQDACKCAINFYLQA